MKNGKKPTMAQKKFLSSKRTDWHDWLVVKDTPTEMVVVHRHFDHVTRTYKKVSEDD